MSENQDNRPNWMKLNPQIDHFDPFEDIGILQDDEISHARYGVKICQQNLLFDKTILCEAAIKSDIYPIPNVPSWIYGMINLRGNIIPVFGIDEFLTDSGATEEKNNVVLVIGEGNDAVGLSIHALPVAIEIDEEKVNTISPPADTPEIFSDCINKAYEIDDKIWLEIDIHTVLDNINSRK
ncbi:MAG: chemotaxis protein CheW [Cyclobacteriaceae bacterium]|nr:chemotaxis protein CheW [Cyclobacteriaceae bacterium]